LFDIFFKDFELIVSFVVWASFANVFIAKVEELAHPRPAKKIIADNPDKDLENLYQSQPKNIL